MTDGDAADWTDANQRHLTASLTVLRTALERRAKEASGADPAAEESLRSALQAMPSPPALDRLAAAFGLTSFERDVVLLCAGVELDSAIASLCAVGLGDSQRKHATFGLALAALTRPHWSALLPSGPLRHWKLVEVKAGLPLTQAPLRIDERILHFLAGLTYLDERLQGHVHPVRSPSRLVPSHEAVAERITSLWSRTPDGVPWPVLSLCGEGSFEKRSIASAACSRLGTRLHLLRAADLPSTVAERESFARLWEREAILSGGALFVDAEASDASELARTIVPFLDGVGGMVLVGRRDPIALKGRTVVPVDVEPVRFEERQSLWRSSLGPLAEPLNGQIDAVAMHFNLGSEAVQAACGRLRSEHAEGGAVGGGLLWEACRKESRSRLDDLAQRITSNASWEDLILPPAQRETLREIAIHVRQRVKVYETWGFGAASPRGLGISALFSGASGTGKTMAAEVLANDLKLDLFRIDLSSVVSKYIGETEKNLKRVFDAAEEGGAVLLFDEADALFGKRSEVKDSHDRYANIEVSYLLQRMEAYRGLAILTTNLKNAIDTAFLRRLRFVVSFPFPDAGLRAQIWRRVFPSSTPTEGLDHAKLSRLSVAGGNIRNIALGAAFLAAEGGEPVRMKHVLGAARGECAKMEKPLAESETRGWS